MKNPQGRLFMVIVFTVTFCLGWLYALITSATPEARNGTMGVMAGLVTVIVMAYFNRSDRAQDATSTSTLSLTTPEPPKEPQ
jgi:hypothetical protein